MAADIDPCKASAAEPLVLLPVRLETRFGSAGKRATLSVRIYPDEVHVDDLARGITEEEEAAGRAYWTAVWPEPPAERAWERLVEAAGPERAEWVAHVLTPTNLGERGSAPAPLFAAVEQRGAGNVVARGLPDRFVVLAIQGGRVSSEVGEPIPAELAMTPIPLDEDEPQLETDALAVPPGSEWLVDYEQAEKIGMAVTVTLDGGRAPVDRVLALGARASLAAAAGAEEFEDLLRGHRFGAGLGLLAQGTPTNNADGDRSPYRARREPQAPPLAPASAGERSDAGATAATLGIDPDLFAGLVGDGNGEQTVARLANTALWQAGWGDYLGQLGDQGVPGLDDHQRESARQLYRDHVRGRGPAAAIRVGAQPYGVLPVSDLAAWEPQVGETTAGIVEVVRRLLDGWLWAAERNVPLIRAGDPKVDEKTLEMLGSSPVMQGLRVRPVITDEATDAVLRSLGLSRDEYEAEKITTAAALSRLLHEDARKMVIGSLHDETRPLPLPLVSSRDPEFIAALLASPSDVLSIDSVLQALLALAWQSNDLDVARAAPAKVVPALIDLVDLDPQLKVTAAAAAARADAAPPEELHGVVAQLQDAGVSVGGPSQLLRFQPAEMIPTSLGEVALAAPETPQSKALAASALTWWLLAMASRNEVREAMEGLAKTDLQARQLAVAEALDCCSHRLDAWATAIVDERRALQLERKGGAAAGRGLTLGAYGVVEDLHPDEEDADGSALDGWIYAPSTGHATAAGILRCADLSHLPAEVEGDGPFAIDLSSRRMRSATHLLDGVRQGQQLGALVGYQIERGLAEAGLARLQLSLRAIAPLVARRLNDADGADPGAVQEAIAATSVVDGVLLLQRHPPGDPTLRSRLDEQPKNAYLEAGDWPPLDTDEWEAVTAVMRDAETAIDAVADVMLSESVLQLASGSPERAAAAMDTMSRGASPDETIEVLEVRESGERLNHRLLALVGDNPPPSGWNASRPRALAEPRLEAWAAARLGDPTEIVVAELAGGRRITLAEVGMAALDLIFADRDQLERTLRIAIPDLGETALSRRREPGWPEELRALGQVFSLAAGLRTLIGGTTPLLPIDLADPGAKPARELGSAMPELTERVTQLAASLAAAVAKLDEAVKSLPADGVIDDPDRAADLTRAAYALEPFGVLLAPDPEHPLDLAWFRSVWQAAVARADLAKARIEQLLSLDPKTPPSLVLDAAQEVATAVLGEGFLTLPLLPPGTDPSAPDTFARAVEEPAFAAPAASELRRFLRDHGTVRPQAMRLSETLLVGDALGHPRQLEAIQLSERDENGEPAPGTTRWLAGPLPAEGPWPQAPVAHVVLDRVGEISAGASIAGLVVDAWVEDLPEQPDSKADPDHLEPDRARTGLAIRSNSASARPPQALLCAISPDGEEWTTQRLRATVEQTLDLARARMVTLERLAGEGLALPALYTRSSSLQGEEHLIFTKFSQAALADLQIPFVKESN
jgi:hypothetical protein